MLEYDRIELSEGIDVNKVDGSCECIIFHYWYFLEILTFRLKCIMVVMSMQMVMSHNSAAIVIFKGNDHKIHFFYISKYEARNLLRNADFTEQSGTL